MRLIGLSVSDHTLVGDGNPLGLAPWVQSHDRAMDRLDKCAALVKSDRYHGVYLSGGCGKLASPRPCGEYQNGETAYTYWAGHDDGPLHSIVGEFAGVMPTIVSIGFPETMNGLDALCDDIAQYEPMSFILDVSGGNTSERVTACAHAIRVAGHEALLESRPLGSLLYPDEEYATMISRARAIMQDGGDLGNDIIVYTGGKNAWIEPEAIGHERRGHLVVQPWGSIVTEGNSGGAV